MVSLYVFGLKTSVLPTSIWLSIVPHRFTCETSSLSSAEAIVYQGPAMHDSAFRHYKCESKWSSCHCLCLGSEGPCQTSKVVERMCWSTEGHGWFASFKGIYMPTHFCTLEQGGLAGSFVQFGKVVWWVWLCALSMCSSLVLSLQLPLLLDWREE
jgi:hypothetical protein